MSERSDRREAHGVHPADRQQVERNLAVIQGAALVGSLLGLASDLFTSDHASALVLLTGATLVGLSMLLRRGGQLRASAMLFLITLVGAIHALCLFGNGVGDLGALLYPVTILCAALLLDRGLLAATTLACIVSVVILVQPADRQAAGQVFDTAIIFVITAVAAFLLVRGVLRGAAEARASERRLAQAFSELEAQNTELERFTHVVSHDLKSPLVTIRGFLDYVEQDARAGEVDRLVQDLERIRTATDRMGRLLDDLLELSRTGRIARPHEDVPFGELVREARTLVGGRLSSSGVEVEVHPDAAAEVVRGDRARLVELLQNLLDNAGKFTGDQEAPRVVVGIRRSRDVSGPIFTIADNGAGIDPAHRERIFDLFHQLDPAVEGSGLGLALVRRIVETHGGRIWAESEGRGKGSTFCFTLQAGQATTR